MTAISNNNSYYRQTLESDNVKKIVTLISASAFYIFHGLKDVALACTLPLFLSTAFPVIFASLNFYGNEKLENWQRRISNQAPSSLLQQVTHRVESITAFFLKKSLIFSSKVLFPSLSTLWAVSLLPWLIIEEGANYIEDLSTKITQRALDALGIPVRLNISFRQSFSTLLKEWENQALPGENRKVASSTIRNIFYTKTRGIRFTSNFVSLSASLNLSTSLNFSASVDLPGSVDPSASVNLSDYQLRDIPNIFHYYPFSNINNLELQNNQLTTLPESINALQQLNYLNLSNNALYSLPDVLYSLPRNCEVVVSSNRFPREEVERIVAIINRDNYKGPRITGISVYEGPQIFGADNFYSILYRTIDRVPKDLTNLPRTKALQSWLGRLIDVHNYRSNQKIINENIVNFLEEANQNETFRKIFTAIIDEASATCGDRVSLSILHLDIAYQLEKMNFADMQKLAIFLLRGGWAIDLLEECARQKIHSTATMNEVEVYLGYPIRLKQELELPISQNSMHYFTESGLTSDDLDNAKEYVRSKLNNKDEALDYLIRHEKWIEALHQNKCNKMAAIEREKAEASNVEDPDYVAIQDRYNQAIKDLSRQILKW